MEAAKLYSCKTPLHKNITIIDLSREHSSDEVKGLIILKEEPFLLRILEFSWVDLETEAKRWNWPELKNYYGSFGSYGDIVDGASVYIVAPEHWQKSAAIGNSFYGLTRYIDMATPSDLVREAIGAMPEGDTIIKEGLIGYDFEKNTLTARGNFKREHQGYYLSHPVLSIKDVQLPPSLHELGQKKDLGSMVIAKEIQKELVRLNLLI